jgi:hypothetical protein
MIAATAHADLCTRDGDDLAGCEELINVVEI